MAKKNPLLDIINKTQPKETASSNSGGGGRSIASQNEAFSQALADKPSTWNPNPVEDKKPKQKKNFLGLNIPDGSENVWDYDATNNIIETSAPAKTKEQKKAEQEAAKKKEAAQQAALAYQQKGKKQTEEIKTQQPGYKDPNAGKSMAGASFSQALAESKKEETPDTNIFRQDVEEAERNRPKAPEPQYFEINGKNMLLPTVVQENGEWKKLTDKEALERYKKTGESLGEYDTPEDAYEAIPELNVTPDDPEATFFSKPAYVLSGAAKQYGSGFVNLYGTTAAGGNELSQALGGNTNEYAGWATDPISAAAIPHENDPEYYEREKRYTDTVMAAADSMSESAAKDIENAKNGLGKLGQFGVDIGTNMIQMGFDVALATLTGGGSALIPMFLRSTGSGEQEARKQGASIAQQILSGNISGGIEVFTEMIADGVAKAYGKGAADKVTEEFIRKMAKTDLGRSALRFFVGAVEEGGEEVLSDILSPLAKVVYNNKSILETAGELSIADILYDFAVGFAVSGATNAVALASGGEQDAVANAALANTDAVQNSLISEGVYARTAAQIAPAVEKALNGEKLSKGERNALMEIRNREDIATSAPQVENFLNEVLGISEAPASAQVEAEGKTEAKGNPATATETGNQLANAAMQASTARANTEVDNSAITPEVPEAPAPTSPEAKGIAAEARTAEELGNPAAEAAQAIETEKVAPEIPAPAVEAEAKTEAKAIEAQEEESTSVDTNPEDHTPKEQSIINDYQASVDEDLKSFIEKYITDPSAKFARKEISFVSDRQQADAERLTGNDYSGYTNNINSNAVNHILNRHGANGVRDNSMADANDISRIGYVLDNYDSAELGEYNDETQKFSKEFRDKDDNPAPVIVFKKKINGTYYVVEAVPDSKWHKFWVITAYMDENGGITQAPSANTPGSTSETSPASLPSESNISQNAEEVNSTEAEEAPRQESSQIAPESQGESEGIETRSEEEKKLNSNLEENTAIEGQTEASEEQNTQTESQESALEQQAEEQATASEEQQSESESEQPKEPRIPKVNENKVSEEKVSQTSTNSLKNVVEQAGGEQAPIKYITQPEVQSLNTALSRVDADMAGEMNSLAKKPVWENTDIDTAMIIRQMLQFDAVNSRDTTAADAWSKVVQAHGTKAAQALQALSKWARTGSYAAAEAANQINENKTLTEEQKNDIKNEVYDFAQRYDGIKDGDTKSLIKLIVDQNAYRNTGTFVDANFEKILKKVNDYNWLKEFALRQMMAIPTDITNPATFAEKAKTWQVNAQLTRMGTFLRNLGGNLSFGILDTFSQDALGFAIDSLVSKATGRKEVGFDKGWLSKQARRAALDAAYRSILEIAGDVDMSGDATKYGLTSNRTFKMTGGGFSKFMSRWEQLLGYSLQTSDKFFRGQIEQSYAQSLEDQVKQGKITEDEAKELASKMADYRLFQNNGLAAQFSKVIHNAFNIAGFGGEVGLNHAGREGGFGVGDLINPYPGVPANLGVKMLEYSPANAVKGFFEIVKLLSDAKNGEAVTGQQMTAVMDIARGLTGAPVIALFAALAKSGLFKNSDDEDDYDVQAVKGTQGLSGTQWNLSATMRWLDGGNSKWKSGDDIMKISWLEPMNGFMSIASMVADEDEDADLKSYAGDFAQGAIQSFLDLPVMENIQGAVKTINQAEGGKLLEKLGEGGANLLGSSLSGMIPAPISQLARVSDDYYRNTTGATKAESAYKAFLNNIPGLRESLPVKYDSFGNPKMNEPDMYNRVMNSFVRPGAINTYTETDSQRMVSEVYEATGDANVYPERKAPKELEFGKEKYALTEEQQEAYQITAGNKYDEYLSYFADNDYYDGLTAEQKATVMKQLKSAATEMAKAQAAEELGVEYEGDYTKLFNGTDVPGEPNDKIPLSEENIADYVTFKSIYNDAINSRNYESIDKYLEDYEDLNNNTRTVLLEHTDSVKDLKNLLNYGDAGIQSESYFKVKDSIADAQVELDKSSKAGSDVKMLGLANADIPEEEKAQIINGVEDFTSKAMTNTYNTLAKYGFDTMSVYEFFTEADSRTEKATGKAVDKGKGTLSADEAAYAISQLPGLSHSERVDIYKKLKKQMSNYFNDWKNYGYDQELDYIKNRSKYSYGTGSSISGSKGKGSGGSSNPLMSILGGSSGGSKKSSGSKSSGSSGGKKSSGNPILDIINGSG